MHDLRIEFSGKAPKSILRGPLRSSAANFNDEEWLSNERIRFDNTLFSEVHAVQYDHLKTLPL